MLLVAKREVGYAAARIITRLRMQLLRSIMRASWGYYARQPVGALANSIGAEAPRAGQGFRDLAETAQHVLMSIAFLGVAMTISPFLIAMATGGGVLIWLLLRTLVNRAGAAGMRQTVLMRSLLTRLTDGMQSIRLLKATASEDAIAPLLEEDTRELKRSLQRQIMAKEWLSALQDPMVAIFVAGAVYVAVVFLGINGGELFVLIYALARGLTTFNKIQRRYQQAAVQSSAIFALLDQIERAESHVEHHAGTAEPRFDHSLEVRDLRVDFDDQPVLRGVSLELAHGGITALSGESGAGKTTLIDALTGLVRPTAGDIVIDGRPLEELDMRAWRRMIGFVPQEPLLMHDSVRANVTLGEDDLDDADVERALRAAAAWEFVSETEGGLDEPVGERGARFSAGQRARIALARALVRRPKLLILDEATSALDADSERKVWEALARLRGETTIVAISHQPYLLSVADRIYRLAEGRVSEEPAQPSAAAAG